MRKLLGRLPVILGTLALGLGGFFLRLRQLELGFDGVGLPTGQGVWPLVILCAVSLAAFLLVALKKEKSSAFEENFPKCFVAVVLYVLAAGLLLAGNIMALTEQNPLAAPVNQMLTRAAAFLGIASGLCFVGAAAGQYKGKPASAAVYLLPVAYYIVQMIFNFKSWSTDPIILDYCFKLFAAICVLLSTLHVAGFALGMGKRRLTVFFCLAGVFFSAVSLADGGGNYVLMTAGSMLWLLANGWQLLGEKK